MKDLFEFVLGIILWIILIWFLIRLQKRNNFFWRTVGKVKWFLLQTDIRNLERTYETATGNFSGLAKVWNKATDRYSDRVKHAALRYYDYLDFCREKNLDLPRNKEQIDNLIEKTEESLMFDNELLDKKLNEGYHEYNDVFKIVDESGNKLFTKRQESVELIEDIEKLINSIAKTPKEFDTDLDEISVHKEEFKNTIQFAEEQHKSLKNSIVKTGVGATAGAAVAALGPSAAMWVATTFGTASTGTAISALSGVAAENAALAWLGGGAVAAGGSGAAGGQALLALAGPIGIGIAASSLLISVLVFYKKYKKMKENKRQEIVRIKNCTAALKDVNVRIDALYNEIDPMFSRIQESLSLCNNLKNGDYLEFSEEQKLSLAALINNSKSLASLLNTVIVDEE